MRSLLATGLMFFSINCFAQHDSDIQKLMRPFTKKEGIKVNRNDTSVLFSLLQKQGTIPNAFIGSLPKPKLAGTNSKGYNVHILPVDNMPVISPGNNYHSNMPGTNLRSNRAE